MGIRFLAPGRARGVRFLRIIAGRRRHPAGVRRHDRRLRAAARDRLRAGGHDLRLGAQRLEAGRELRARRLHRHHPRQALPRGDQGDRQPGDEVSGGPLPRGARHGRSAAGLRLTSSGRGYRGGAARAVRARRSRRASTSSAICVRVGIANQTTMLSGESLAIAEEVRRSMARRYGDAAVAEHFRSFDTICSATQERQDAVVALLEEPLDVMVVVGGYNSQQHLPPRRAGPLARGPRLPHRGRRRDRSRDGTVRHQPIGTKQEVRGRRAGSARPGSSASRPAPPRRTTRSARRSRGSAGPPAWSCAAGARRTPARATLPRPLPHHHPRHDHVPRPAGADHLRLSEPGGVARSCTRPGWSSRSARSRWWPTPGPTWTRRSTAMPTARTCRALAGIARRPGRGGGARRDGGRAVRSSLRRSTGARAPGPGGAGAHRLGSALGHRALPLGNPFLTADAAEIPGGRRARRSSGSTRSTSTTSATAPARSTRRCSAPGSRSSSTCAGWSSFPPAGFRFSAVPPKVAGFGTLPVRAYAAT